VIREPPAVREVVRASPSSPRRQRATPPAGAPSLASRFLAGRPVRCDDPEALAATVWELEDRLEGSADDTRFTDSGRTERAVETARAQLLESLERQPASRQAEILARQADSRREFEEFSRTMAYREQQLEARLRAQVQQLRDRHARECTEHDQQWLVEPKQRLFSRSSQKLRILRLQRQLLLTSHEPGSGSSSERSGERTPADFDGSRAHLDQKHADELESLLQACDLKRGEFRYIRDTLARKFAGGPDQPPPDAERLWARAKKGGDAEQGPGLPPTKKKVQVTKTTNAADFNTLPLPPLEMDQTIRKKRKVGASKT
jgi:hypothetical protein